MDISLVPVDSENWNDVAVLEVSEERVEFTASGSYYLCLCHYDGMWTPLAVMKDGEVAGFIMWAEEEKNGPCWLGGLMVDSRFSSIDFGKAIIRELLSSLKKKDYKEFFISCAPDDHSLAETILAAGFEDTGKEEEGEKIYRLLGQSL